MFPFIKCMLYLLENSILDKPKVTGFQLVDQLHVSKTSLTNLHCYKKLAAG